jgi:hypothetical protein
VPKNGRQVAIVREIAAADALRHTTPTAEEIYMATMLQSLGLAIYQAAGGRVGRFCFLAAFRAGGRNGWFCQAQNTDQPFPD